MVAGCLLYGERRLEMWGDPFLGQLTFRVPHEAQAPGVTAIHEAAVHEAVDMSH